MYQTKTIYSLRVMMFLTKKGISYVLEKDNPNKPGFKCWVYEWTEEFQQALDEVLGGARNG